MWRYLIIMIILIFTIHNKMQIRDPNDESVPIYSIYRFSKFITVHDYKMLYQIIYGKKICCITFLINGEMIKQMIMKRGHVLEYEKDTYDGGLRTAITRTAKSMTFNLNPIGVKITFAINSRVKISTRSKNYTNVIAICRVYDI